MGAVVGRESLPQPRQARPVRCTSGSLKARAARHRRSDRQCRTPGVKNIHLNDETTRPAKPDAEPSHEIQAEAGTESLAQLPPETAGETRLPEGLVATDEAEATVVGANAAVGLVQSAVVEADAAVEEAFVPAGEGFAPDVEASAAVEATDAADASAGETSAAVGEADAANDEAETLSEPDEPRTTFADLGLSDELLRAVSESGYIHPTPIQEQAIPVVLMNRDVLGCAQTGTGKTASFVLPMLDILSGSRAKARMPRSLILEPTRELALQVAENFVKYGKYLGLNHALLIGGESMDEQKRVLNEGVDVLIATPGRLLDMFDRGRILMADCKLLVIDEADRMLDMGFIPDVERIVGMLPPTRQTLFFSATMAPEIRRLADAFLQNPREITVSRPASVATTITSALVYVQPNDKREALRRLIVSEDVGNALIFCNRKIEVDVLYKSLKKHGFKVGALHGDLDQSVRFSTLNAFKANELQLLVCSDVAARGIDIGGLSHVFNFDVPFHSEDYVHRVGRTGRAGREGRAFSIATSDDARNVAGIEKLIGQQMPRIAIEGLDIVSDEEIAEAMTKPRGRGRAASGRSGSAAAGRSGSAAAGRPAATAGRPGSRTPERSGRGTREERAPREDRAPRERAVRPRRDVPTPAALEVTADVQREAPAAGGRGEGRGETRNDGRSESRSEGRGEGREDRPRLAESRDDRPRRPEGRPEGRPESRDDRPRRRDDDLGPSVRGFGDSTPAFMLIAIPKFRRERPADAPETEAPAPEIANAE